ncbi:hypothetical protein PF005_g29660 [Phytophthora fragariae]|uniref:Uncharacterized protein n=1 Tax=Phytophthora fragariae TaxID=53985 RepID=A0A6A3VEJ3_9STRA|nr:hypothetical protein PF005_g29660 [Phytophthora fragariae]
MGFRFRNQALEWFQARATRVDPSLVRTVAEDLQQLLAVEFLEWRGVISDVVTRIVPALSLQALNDEIKSEEGDVTMLEYESGLLGREWLLRMKAAGIRKVRSPASSAIDKPEPKRSQFGPPRPSSIPSLSSHLSYPASVRTIQDVDDLSGPMSVAQSTSSRRTPDRESSIFGTTVAGSDESNFSNISGSRSSGRVSSFSSSMWSLGGAEASNHIRYAGLSGVVMMAQGGVARGGGDVGVQISDTTLTPPLVLVDQDDVAMSESGHVSIRSDRRSKKSHVKPRRRKTSKFQAGKPVVQAWFQIEKVSKSVCEVGMDKTLGTIRSFDEIGPLGIRAVYDEVYPGSVIPDGAQTRSSRSSTGSIDPASGSSNAGESCTAHSQRRSSSPGSYTTSAFGKRCSPNSRCASKC